ncbi:hypothetical protein BC938DRAFT_484233 [Jimgerdemannia flammicorona]|uniref:Uncharacterized protein n=1 Tax=Jimgerdemannia flammicorona TaxID=994334 RepID=A0A433QVB1_9FUNG|nr:hypothetical protein BC938DRAFT_484233 [Jimgerdemannia flammicorona]
MHYLLFLHIVEAVEAYDAYFQQKPDTLENLGLLFIQKYITAICQLIYGMPANAVDKYVQIAETIAIRV